ncbi:MAG TPA: transketolase [Actinobacteria bacterium]|nr:transketolase [Actinomycetota bacterium]
MDREKLRQFLEEKARVLRWDIIKMIGEAGSGHPGGSLSAADIVAVLYFHHMRHRPDDPKWPERDRFILSKGHACPVLYATLAECGYFPREILWTLRKFNSILQGHPDMRRVPGVEISSGSLGLGLAAANGMASAGKMDGKDYRVYVMIGDGESQEGVVWEASMFAAHYKLDNLVAILDNNGLQIDGPVSQVMEIQPVVDKWRAFGWRVLEVDGHNVLDIADTLVEADKTRGQPMMIVAHTIKGKGVSFMENVVDFHGKAPTKEQMEEALKELS